jgi:hypothetical protein
MSEITIQKIQFFTPAMVTYVKNGDTLSCQVNVDVRNETVLVPDDAPPELATLFFPHLTDSLRMPSDSYEADEETYDKADKANKDFEKAHRDHIGDNNVG